GRASQWFKPYMDLLENQSPSFRNTKFELNSLSMKDNGKASTYISQFRTLQSRVNWNDATFAFHFRKGLPSRITDQLALTGQQLKTLQHKKADSIPSTSKNEDALKHKSSKNFPLKLSACY
ncbi:uncharacterized protein VP01_11223g1, partial [Puccinia sorghi]